MVKFGLKLEDNRVDKWSSHYLDYKKLKKAIKQLVRSRNLASTISKRYITLLFYTNNRLVPTTVVVSGLLIVLSCTTKKRTYTSPVMIYSVAV